MAPRILEPTMMITGAIKWDAPGCLCLNGQLCFVFSSGTFESLVSELLSLWLCLLIPLLFWLYLALAVSTYYVWRRNTKAALHAFAARYDICICSKVKKGSSRHNLNVGISIKSIPLNLPRSTTANRSSATAERRKSALPQSVRRDATRAAVATATAMLCSTRARGFRVKEEEVKRKS